MTIIKVDPSILKNESSEIVSTGKGIDQCGKSVHNAVSGAPDYDGQFGPVVKSIGNEAMARSAQLNFRMSELSDSLSGRADAFKATDMAGQIGFNNLNRFTMNFLSTDQLSLLKLLGNRQSTITAILKNFLAVALIMSAHDSFTRIKSIPTMMAHNLSAFGTSVKGFFSGIQLSWLRTKDKPIDQTSTTDITIENDSADTNEIVLSEHNESERIEIINFIQSTTQRLPNTDQQGNLIHEECVAWAKERREDMGGTPLPYLSNYPPYPETDIATETIGAKKFIQIFKSSVIKIDSSHYSNVAGSSLISGAALVQNRERGEYGHIMIVEKVNTDGIWVSDSNWDTNLDEIHDSSDSPRFIDIEKLNGWYIIPKNAEPG